MGGICTILRALFTLLLFFAVLSGLFQSQSKAFLHGKNAFAFARRIVQKSPAELWDLQDRLWRIEQLVKMHMPPALHVGAWTLTHEIRNGIKAIQRQHDRDIDEIRKAHEKEIALQNERQRYE